VNMTGETTNGIAFGATVRADNAGGGNSGTAGSVFVSGIYGTLTAGDTNGADEQHVGDVVGVGLTGLGDLNETLFFSNGGSFGPDDEEFALDTDKRPTLRYDYDFGALGFPGLGFSMSTDRQVKDLVLGASYTFDLGDGNSVGAGIGYGDISTAGRLFGDDIEQLSAMVEATFFGIEGKLVYSDVSAGTLRVDADGEPILDATEDEFTTYGIGLGYSFGDIGVTGFYHRVDSAGGRIAWADGADAYGVGFTYNLGGGATLAGGIVETFSEVTVADFGIRMNF
jgi:outer membrane protein OmpU